MNEMMLEMKNSGKIVAEGQNPNKKWVSVESLIAYLDSLSNTSHNITSDEIYGYKEELKEVLEN